MPNLIKRIFPLFFIFSSINAQSKIELTDLQKKVNYLCTEIENFRCEDSDNIQLLNGEWILFSQSFSSFALTNIALHDSSFKEKAVKHVNIAITNVLSVSQFGYQSLLNLNEADSMASILFYGHLNLMITCYRTLTNDSTFNQIQELISNSLVKRYNTAKFGLLPTYGETAWIPDNCVAIASLFGYNNFSGSINNAFFEKFSEKLQTEFTDKKTNLLISSIDISSGEILDNCRGSMVGWSIFFIEYFNHPFAHKQYLLFKEKLSRNFIFFRLFKEHYKGSLFSFGDVDSGPIVLGFSIPANAFAYGNANLFSDKKTAKQLKRIINIGTRRIERNEKINYKIRFIDFPVSPMAEALMLYFETLKLSGLSK
ncbi:MAG TPA: hypothetical protein DCQ31_11500 [Bacteroidales bacterium]|nr:hypothetical protein [Bacteroidales bacterium]